MVRAAALDKTASTDRDSNSRVPAPTTNGRATECQPSVVLRKMSSRREINGLQPFRVTMLTLRRRIHNEALAGDCGLSVEE
jgi:hypothetical protein